jgi:probable HAF family extracellular repeat protein
MPGRPVVPIALLTAASLFSAPSFARAQDVGPASRFHAVDLGLPAANGIQVVALNRRGQVAVYTTTSTSEGTSFTCWLYDNGVLTNLGTLGGKVCQPTAMNDSGQIVGHSTTAEGYAHPFIYANGRMTDIGVLSGASSPADSGFAWAINSSGAVVGQSQTAAGQTHTFLYENGQLRDIDPDALFSAGLAINDAGQITGVRAVPGSGSTAYRYLNGRFEDINAPGMQSSIGRLINRAGDVAGSITMQAEQHAFLFSGGALGDIGTLGGPNAFPSAMNDLAQIAGFAFTSGDIFHAIVARGGTLVDLGSLGSAPNDFSRARSINKWGHVVGWTATPDGATTAFFSNRAGIQDLRTLVTSDAVPEMNDAQCINDVGQIAATGMVGGRPHAFLLTPASAPTSLAVSAATVRYGDHPQLMATLASSSTPVAQKAITFAIDGVTVGTATTDDNGVARLTAIDTTPAGTHTLSAAFAADEVYEASSSSAMLDVRNAPLTITANSATRFIGAENPAFTASYGGFVLGETPAVMGGTLTLVTDATRTSPVGVYTITPSGLSSPNYDITYVNGSLTVMPNICVRFDSWKPVRAGRTIPIKLDHCDRHGRRWSYRSWFSMTDLLRRLSEEGDNDFRDVGFGYLFNLRTKELTTGMWDLLFSATGDPVRHDGTFHAR